MRLEYLGQFWNAETRRVHLVGRGEGAIRDLTHHLPYRSVREQLLRAMSGSPALPLLSTG